MELSALNIVIDQIRSLAPQGTTHPDLISPDSLLTEHLGLDSMMFVELTVALEAALDIEVFPMQEWVDEQWETTGKLTVGALAEKCHELTANR